MLLTYEFQDDLGSIASDNDFYYEPNPWLSDSISTVPSASPIPLSPQGSIHSDNNNSFIFHHDYDYGYDFDPWQDSLPPLSPRSASSRSQVPTADHIPPSHTYSSPLRHPTLTDEAEFDDLPQHPSSSAHFEQAAPNYRSHTHMSSSRRADQNSDITRVYHPSINGM